MDLELVWICHCDDCNGWAKQQWRHDLHDALEMVKGHDLSPDSRVWLASFSDGDIIGPGAVGVSPDKFISQIEQLITTRREQLVAQNAGATRRRNGGHLEWDPLVQASQVG